MNDPTGSSCLLTTRLKTSANIASFGYPEPYFLRNLRDNDCWSILTQTASVAGEVPEVLNAHEEQILKTCRGLPLAAKVIGGLLRLQKKEKWSSIVEDGILKFGGNNNDDVTMQILKLSFDHLPSPSIKKFFSYCSVFEKDAVLDGDALIELWMAEGFLQAKNVKSGTSMEDIGEKYLEILVQSSLLEKVYSYYQIHDLIHDLVADVSD